jgi:hypothetical protein
VLSRLIGAYQTVRYRSRYGVKARGLRKNRQTLVIAENLFLADSQEANTFFRFTEEPFEQPRH